MVEPSKLSITALSRLKNEEFELKSSQSKFPKGCTVKPKANGMSKDYSVWIVTFLGREKTFWEGGKYRGELRIPSDYPNVAPTFIFDKINGVTLKHVNIFADGRVCIDILTGNAYSPDKSLFEIIIALDSWFYDPNPKSPANGEMNSLFLKDPVNYEKIIRAQAAETKKLKI